MLGVGNAVCTQGCTCPPGCGVDLEEVPKLPAAPSTQGGNVDGTRDFITNSAQTTGFSDPKRRWGRQALKEFTACMPMAPSSQNRSEKEPLSYWKQSWWELQATHIENAKAWSWLAKGLSAWPLCLLRGKNEAARLKQQSKEENMIWGSRAYILRKIGFVE